MKDICIKDNQSHDFRQYNHKINIDKVKTLQDVINIIDALDIKITSNGIDTPRLYEKLKDYLDPIE